MFLLFDDSDLQGCRGLLYSEEKLSDMLNFLANIEVGVNVSSIGALKGENIFVQFVIVQCKLKLKVKKGKMVQPQSTLVTNVKSFAMQKKSKRAKKERTKTRKREKFVDKL